MAMTYVGALGKGYPKVIFSSSGTDNIYENISWITGEPLPSKAELDAYILQSSKDGKWEEIKAERDRRKAAGVKVDTKWYHSDDTSRIQYLGLAMYGANMPTGIMWKTMDGTFIEMSPALVQQISGTIGSSDVDIFTIAEQHKSAMLASQDPVAYDIFNGNPAWPLVYGEE